VDINFILIEEIPNIDDLLT